MGENAKNPQDNSTKNRPTKRRGTVSMRNMDMELWYKMGYEAKMEGITTTQYISRLLEKDLSNKQ